MEEKRYLNVKEFANKANLFFDDIIISSEIVEELINKGYLPFHDEKEIVPTDGLLEFNPYSLLSARKFAKRAGIAEEYIKALIKSGEIKTLRFMNNKIHIKEFREYAKEHNVEVLYNSEDLYEMLDNYFRSSTWWDNFFSDREKPVPFFVDVPDENLVSYFEKGIIKPKKVLELGCGNGRNAVFLAKQGCQVDAVDMSKEAISWGEEMAKTENVIVNFIHSSIFKLNIEDQAYDFVYDAGCFHHIPPHRRFTYKGLIEKALKPKKHFALSCFNSKMGNGYTDWEVYEKRSLGGGLAYNQKEIENIFLDLFELKEFREMKDIEDGKKLFGKPFMWSILFEKRDVE